MSDLPPPSDGPAPAPSSADQQQHDSHSSSTASHLASATVQRPGARGTLPPPRLNTTLASPKTVRTGTAADLSSAPSSASSLASPAPTSFGSGAVPHSPRPVSKQRRKKHYYLQITISEAKRGALPGYEGDRRVEWAVSDDASSTVDSAERTRDALDTLRQFWDDLAPEELGFSEFVWCVFGDDFEREGKENESELTTHMAARLAGSTIALSAFLADVRDWDAFRLLIRRRAGRLPVALADRGHERRRRNRAAARDEPAEHPRQQQANLRPRSPSMRDEAVRMLASEAFFYVLAEKEAEWTTQRVALETALAAAERKVQRIVHSVTGALGGAIGEVPLHPSTQRTDSVVRRSLDSLRAMESNPPSGRSPRLPTPSTSSLRNLSRRTGATTATPPTTPSGERKVKRRLSKKVSFDDDTINREDVKDRLRISLSDDLGESPSDSPVRVTPLAIPTIITTTVDAAASPSDSGPASKVLTALPMRGSHVPVSASATVWRELAVGREPDNYSEEDFYVPEEGNSISDADTDQDDDDPIEDDSQSSSSSASGSSSGTGADQQASEPSSHSSGSPIGLAAAAEHHQAGGVSGLYRQDNSAFLTPEQSAAEESGDAEGGSSGRSSESTRRRSSSQTSFRKTSCLDFARPRGSSDSRRPSQSHQTRPSIESVPPHTSFPKKLGKFLKSKVSSGSLRRTDA
ncbi:hypothetical protein HKX48_003717 [Thoreauomyces humboldtii]|nr:hypothetical protein HKX48_003717 [Thoreauomyces humboldtii]